MAPPKKSSTVVAVNPNDDSALEAFIASVNKDKQFGDNCLYMLGKNFTGKYDCWTTGLIAYDEVVGNFDVGNFGFVRGRQIEIGGAESAGKTTLCLAKIASIQRMGGRCAYIDAEHAFDPIYAKKCGVNVDELVFSQPDSGIQGLNLAYKLVLSGFFHSVFIDSVPALIPPEIMEKGVGDPTVGALARLISNGVSKINQVCGITKTNVFWINQVRDKIGFMASGTTTPGGRALKHYSSVRIEVTRVGNVVSSGEVVGIKSKIKVIKNKCAPPFREIQMESYFSEQHGLWGFCEGSDLYNTALELEMINESGNKKMFAKKINLGLGETKSKSIIQNDPEIKRIISTAIRELKGYPTDGKPAFPTIVHVPVELIVEAKSVDVSKPSVLGSGLSTDDIAALEALLASKQAPVDEDTEVKTVNLSDLDNLMSDLNFDIPKVESDEGPKDEGPKLEDIPTPEFPTIEGLESDESEPEEAFASADGSAGEGFEG